ncbi:MAG TPA: NAD(P)-binding domain-containing protein [Propionibacteriaceae bacterium]
MADSHPAGASLSARKIVTVAVIGAGQAGLAVGYYLTGAGIDNVIIDAAPAVGDSWRNRWDTLRLFTPAKHDSLPGLPFPAPAGSFPTKDQTAAYLQLYAEHHNLRTRLGHRVDRLRRDAMGFVLTVDNETIHATYVVVATGAHQTKGCHQLPQDSTKQSIKSMPATTATPVNYVRDPSWSWAPATPAQSLPSRPQTQATRRISQATALARCRRSPNCSTGGCSGS